MKKLFVGNCDYNVDESALQEFIESNGLQVSSVKLVRDRFTDRSRGFAFVELSGSEDLEKAIEVLNGKELQGRALTVNEARESKPRFGQGGGRSKSFGGRRGGKGRGPAH